jgi:hypothetical protein
MVIKGATVEGGWKGGEEGKQSMITLFKDCNASNVHEEQRELFISLSFLFN